MIFGYEIPDLRRKKKSNNFVVKKLVFVTGVLTQNDELYKPNEH